MVTARQTVVVRRYQPEAHFAFIVLLPANRVGWLTQLPASEKTAAGWLGRLRPSTRIPKASEPTSPYPASVLDCARRAPHFARFCQSNSRGCFSACARPGRSHARARSSHGRRLLCASEGTPHRACRASPTDAGDSDIPSDARGAERLFLRQCRGP